MALNLVIGAKGSDDILFTGTTGDAKITGLEPGTVVATGDYQAWNIDSAGKLTPSAKVDVEGFTVLPAQAAAPTSATVTPTIDGAEVTSK